MLDKNDIKRRLEKERDSLFEEISGIGKFDSVTNNWEAVPEKLPYTESDPNDNADRFEDFESRTSTVEILETRLKDVLGALQKLSSLSFGLCKTCNVEIEEDRLLANPAATTCKEHINK